MKPEIVSNIYDCAINDTRWGEVIDRTVSFADARGALLGSVKVGAGDGTPDWSLSSGSECWRSLAPEQIEYIKSKFLAYQIETWTRLSNQEKLGFVYDNGGAIEDAELAGREDYIFRREKLGIVRSICFRLSGDLGWFDTFVAHFGEQYQAVPQQSQLILSELAPHLSKSVELARTFSILQSQYKAVLAALDHVSIGLCIVQPDRVVAISNTEALRISDETGLIKLDTQNRLACNCPEANGRLNQAIDKANNIPVLSMPGSETFFRIEGSDGQAVLVETTHLSDSRAELGEVLNCALVSMVDLSNTEHIDTNRLSLVYSLTNAEKAVCRLLVQGRKNDEIAERRNVSPQTIKSQVASIYNKTSVNSRSDLIRLSLKVSPPVILNG